MGWMLALQPMKAAVVLNPSSGRGRAIPAADRVCRALAQAGVVPVRVAIDAPAEDMRVACEGARAVVAVGGDGTVRSMAARLAGGDVPLAIVPTGTENLAARALGFRCSVRTLVGAVVDGAVRRIDLGEACVVGRPPHVFVVMASVGLDADVVAALDATRVGPISHRSYVAPILRVARGWSGPWIEVEAVWPPDREAPGGPSAGFHGGVLVANLRQYALGLNPARDADAADGALDAVALPARAWPEVVATAARLLAGRPMPVPDRLGRAAAWSVRLSQPAWVQADGDPVPGGPASEVQFRCMAGALPVVSIGRG
ncbi:MAG: hypothetical protein RI990_2054 [Planctomycetota bacterium]